MSVESESRKCNCGVERESEGRLCVRGEVGGDNGNVKLELLSEPAECRLREGSWLKVREGE